MYTVASCTRMDKRILGYAAGGEERNDGGGMVDSAGRGRSRVAGFGL
jgi:hypothetical protein